MKYADITYELKREIAKLHSDLFMKTENIFQSLSDFHGNLPELWIPAFKKASRHAMPWMTGYEIPP